MNKTTTDSDDGRDVRQALGLLPRIAASPDFELRVYQKVVARQASPLGWLDRLDNVFAIPAVKLLGSAAGGLFTGLIVLLAIGGGKAPAATGALPQSAPTAIDQPPTIAEAMRHGDDYAAIFEMERDIHQEAPTRPAPVRRPIPAPPLRGDAKEGSWILGALPESATASASSSGSLC